MEERICDECGMPKLLSAFAMLNMTRNCDKRKTTCKHCNLSNAMKTARRDSQNRKDKHKNTIDPKWLTRGKIDYSSGQGMFDEMSMV